MSDSSEISSSVGTRLLLENDAVRVWDLQLAPGESTGQHRHLHDYFYVVIGEGMLQRVDPDGTIHPPKHMADGEVHFRKVDGESVHAAVNVGETVWRNIVVELKRS
jgi:beta-alanine degradation protein BauB